MQKLVTGSGRMACHHMGPDAKRNDGLPPIDLTSQGVSAKHKSEQAGAIKLTHSVMRGSKANQSHWKCTVLGLALPRTAVATNAVDAKQLVNCLLSLVVAKNS